ncbi:MAG: hypothetical protein AAFQ63_04260 [Cyanobacteria bacterium J06621_11]
MMSQFNNWFSTLNAYADMSPDLMIRHEVNQWMKDRTRVNLGLSEWCHLFEPYSKNKELLTFVYQRFSQYSGLTFGRVRPRDTMHEELKFALVCWHDWVITFCDDFCEHFHIDLSDYFDEDEFETIGEIVEYLGEQIAREQEKTNARQLSHRQGFDTSSVIAS